ncbi:BamA/TamA family outer membrane protein [Pontibacter sp. BT731]|uniref:translocation and assembly module lipoprotein TamL n=1 Tax=Pontibacter coccineus TaxID=3063328 RepID=UPI0026E2F07E|nr:BamA/TamA family outer membrane protein [Pontibacter sp. BT731]MDO6391441.1 BamA/TamA family outer membrane protein [Pontibacter sp. BT731]
MPTKNLGENEQLLLGIEPKGINHVSQTDIEALYEQQPNRTFLASTPYLAIYNFGKKFYSPSRIDERIEELRTKRAEKIAEVGGDSTKSRRIQDRFDRRIARQRDRKEEGNLLMQIGEPPAIYDSLLMGRTMDQIEIYMNTKGFFNHELSYEKQEKGKKVYITLNIEENEPYRYSEFSYTIPDDSLLKVVKRYEDRSLLKVGDVYDEQVISAERDRLYEMIRHNGYFDFARAYTEFEVDTSFGGNTVKVNTIIQNPEDQSAHKAYTIRNVYFKTDADRFGLVRDTLEYNNVKYLAYDQKFSPNILDKKVSIYPGQRYSQFRTSLTQRRLAEMDVFQFNNVSYSKITDLTDSLSGNQLNAFVNAVPSKKFQETTELGLTYSERRPGPFSTVRLKIRNVFGGAENLELGIRGGLEGQYNISNPEKTVMIREFGGDAALTFPLFILPFGGKNILQDFNPRTRLYAGYTNVNRLEFQRTLYEASLDYIWYKYPRPLQTPTVQYVFSPVNVNVIQVGRIDPTFEADLRELSDLSRSFIESFRSGFVSFIGFNLIYNTNDFIQSRNARYIRVLSEVGGLSSKLGILPEFGNLRQFQYAKINPDYRRYIPLGGQRYFVYRVNAGVGGPLFGSSALPYDKYFFAGGAASVRAWTARRLGPGSYRTLRTDEVDGETVQRPYVAEQPGEVLLEASAEYRFNMVGFLNGALFVDAGNVWMLKPDSRPGSEFQFNRFYKELAVGTGFGLRLNFSVVILRFDFATQVYDPAGDINGNKFVIRDFRFSDFFRQTDPAERRTNLNIGIGYPF